MGTKKSSYQNIWPMNGWKKKLRDANTESVPSLEMSRNTELAVG